MMWNKIVVGIFLVLIFTGCEKVDELTKFEMEFSESFTIAAGTPLDLPLNISTPAIDPKYEEIYSTYNTRADRIEEIVLKSLEFSIESPEEGSFDFLESVEVSMSTAGQPDEAIAFKTDILNDGSTSLVLETSDSNLKDYVSVNQFTLKSNTVMDEVISTDHTVNVKAVFFVDARVLGQ